MRELSEMAKKRRATAGDSFGSTGMIVSGEILPGITTEASANLQIGPEMVVNSAVAAFERRVRREIEAGQTECERLKKLRDEAEDKLQVAVQGYAKKYRSDVTKKAREFYKVQGLKLQVETTTSLVTSGKSEDRRAPSQEVDVQLLFFSEKVKQRSYYNRSDESFNYTNEWRFTARVSLADAGLEALATASCQAKAEYEEACSLQLRWREQLSRLPSVERQARGQIAEFVLSQSETGRRVRETMTDKMAEHLLGPIPSFETKALKSSKQ
jgi:hypothetical protein